MKIFSKHYFQLNSNYRNESKLREYPGWRFKGKIKKIHRHKFLIDKEINNLITDVRYTQLQLLIADRANINKSNINFDLLINNFESIEEDLVDKRFLINDLLLNEWNRAYEESKESFMNKIKLEYFKMYELLKVFICVKLLPTKIARKIFPSFFCY